MAISLSEQLESDIKEYLHKTFGTYFSSLDERFAADIKKDVISASDFHHEHYNDDDISIAFQRVTLGRMGHLDWQIYHLCTDTEANTMKQNVKVNTPIHIRPASYEEAGLFYSQMEEGGKSDFSIHNTFQNQGPELAGTADFRPLCRLQKHFNREDKAPLSGFPDCITR